MTTNPEIPKPLIEKIAQKIWLKRQANNIEGCPETDWEKAIETIKKHKQLIWLWKIKQNLKIIPLSFFVSFKSIIYFFCKTLPTSDWIKVLGAPLVLSVAGSIISSQIQQENRQNECPKPDNLTRDC